MNSRATAAVFDLTEELTAEEFRVLILISKISVEQDGWLIAGLFKILRHGQLTANQLARILYGLHCDNVIALGAQSPAQQPLTIDRLRKGWSMGSSPHLYVWITGMPEPKTVAEPAA
jgi:hypothetical protein